MRLRTVLALALLTLAGGCGGSDAESNVVPVAGAIELDGQPLVGAEVTFVPTGTTSGLGGRGYTDEKGAFTLKSPRGADGVPAGAYRVVVSRRVMPDGKPVPPDDPTPPAESPARESIPPAYSDYEASTLTATVTDNGSEPKTFAINSKGGRSR